MITIYWHCLGMTKADETFVADALNELAQILRKEPIKLLVKINALTDEPELSKEVDERLNRLSDQSYTFSLCAALIRDAFHFEERLLVYCCPDSYIADAARGEKPSALYGATCGSFAAVYRPNYKVTIWHEALHLLGLDECYDENTLRRKCKCKTCVMQYKPPKGVDENWPSPLCDNLCDKQKEKLRELAKKVEEVHKRKKTS